jgi:hypothetical protein
MESKNLSTDLYGIILGNLVFPCLNPENLFDFFDFAVDILFCSKLWVKFRADLRGIFCFSQDRNRENCALSC